MDSRTLFDRVAGWAGKTFSGRLTRQARRAAIRQHRRLHKQADRLAPESLEQRALLAAVVAGYEVVNDWGGGFQGGLTLANQDTQSYGDWTVSFDYGADITSIWDARVVSREGSRYTIANAGYNAAFDPGAPSPLDSSAPPRPPAAPPTPRPISRSTASHSMASRPPRRRRSLSPRPFPARRRVRGRRPRQPIRRCRLSSHRTGAVASTAM